MKLVFFQGVSIDRDRSAGANTIAEVEDKHALRLIGLRPTAIERFDESNPKHAAIMKGQSQKQKADATK